MKSKNTKEDIISSVREEHPKLSEHINSEANDVKRFNISKTRDVLNLLAQAITIPFEFEPVLANISQVNDLGKSQWYEVVYHNGTNWCCYSGSTTFTNGEVVFQWVYCKDAL